MAKKLFHKSGDFQFFAFYKINRLLKINFDNRVPLDCFTYEQDFK